MITTLLLLDGIGIFVGILSIAVIFKKKSILGGKVGNALNMFVWGISSIILAFTWTIIFKRLNLLSSPSIDIHHLLMTVGMIFFVLAAQKFTSIIQQ